jgi:hypothetical protein
MIDMKDEVRYYAVMKICGNGNEMQRMIEHPVDGNKGYI